MSKVQPLAFIWSGSAMTPCAPSYASKQFTVGEKYLLAHHEERSTASHNLYFAIVNEAFKTLPEKVSKRFLSAEHLRKWALIEAGYADEKAIACETQDEAVRVAALFKDDYLVVSVHDTVVRVYTAKTQKTTGPGAMDKDDFHKSKEAVLEIVAGLIGVDVKTLSGHAHESLRRELARPTRCRSLNTASDKTRCEKSCACRSAPQPFRRLRHEDHQ